MSEVRLNFDELAKRGLEPRDIAVHAERIREVTSGGKPPCFKITDTCRLSNGGILPLSFLKIAESVKPRQVVAFIPAAGAASRYFKPLAPLMQNLAENKLAHVPGDLLKLRQEGAERWALPAALASLVSDPRLATKLTPEAGSRLLNDLQQPKALLPCEPGGRTFLQQKLLEHAAMPYLAGQVFVAPPLSLPDFAKVTPTAGHGQPPARLLPQGPKLSTIRFLANGEPFIEGGGYSIVPAGHGTLLKLFPAVKELFPRAESVFIRNIDNVMTDMPTALAATEAFLRVAQDVRDTLIAIRAALAANDREHAVEQAKHFLSRATLPQLSKAERQFLDGKPLLPLWELQIRLFQTAPALVASQFAGMTDDEVLRLLYERPLNVLGQVPNTEHDVGGTPVFVETPAGPVKVCLELPHAEPSDVKAFLANPEKATHFNPVFAVAELVDDLAAYEKSQSQFWILAKKTFAGRTMYYHETVLYELIGNNLTTNVLFIEVPRAVFHPHKSLDDTSTRQNPHT